MKRRDALAAFIATSAAPGAVFSQTSGKVWRIGHLSLLPGPTEHLAAFVEAMRSLGYVEVRNLHIENRWAAGKLDQLPDMARDLVQLKVDVILAATGPVALAAKRATNSIPIVISTVPDPVGLGLVTSLARPGGNVTGITNMATDLAGKRVQLLRELLPKTTRIAVLVMKAGPATPLFLEQLRPAAQLTGVELIVLSENQPEALTGAFAATQQGRAQALIVQTSPFAFNTRQRIVELAAQHRLPALFESREYVDLGGLLSYGPSLIDLVRRSAYFVDRIFKGAIPADLPVEQPTRFEMVINLKTAKALGLTIPHSLRLQATEMIE